MTFRFSKEIYNKRAVLQAAYSYTDRAYIHIDISESHYIVDVESKDGEFLIDEKEFQNELLMQMIRQQVRQETRAVRELLLARAFSSTVIESQQANYETDEEPIDIGDILTDWFDKNEEA